MIGSPGGASKRSAPARIPSKEVKSSSWALVSSVAVWHTVQLTEPSKKASELVKRGKMSSENIPE
jgi:hypothetical protein